MFAQNLSEASMGRATPPGDQRQSFRCNVSNGRTECSLKVGQHALPARLLDESAGGFAVEVDQVAGLNAGDTGLLLTDVGWFSVRIVHIAEQAADPDAAPSYRLGLLRLSDATPYQAPRVSLWAGTLRFRLGQWTPTNTPLVLFVVLLTVVTVLAALYLTKSRWPVTVFDNAPDASPDPDRSSDATPANPFRTKFHSSRVRQADESYDDSPFDSPSQFGRNPVRRRGSASSGSSSEWMLHESVRRMAGASALTMPEVIQRLQLTDPQQAQIRRLIDQTVDAIRQMERQSVGRSRGERAQLRAQLLEQSRQEAVNLLTDSQRAEWDRLMTVPKPD
ncbi:MAG: hypothetical protein ABFC77_03870 [Thermoguttaceae bacterium]